MDPKINENNTAFLKAAQDKFADDFIKFCNNLRCPLCKSQLDGVLHYNKAKLYCVANNDEYKCEYISRVENPELVNESIRFWYPQWEYTVHIYKTYDDIEYETCILRGNMDYPVQFRGSTRKQIFLCKGRILLFRQRMEEEILLKKLSLYSTFS